MSETMPTLDVLACVHLRDWLAVHCGAADVETLWLLAGSPPLADEEKFPWKANESLSKWWVTVPPMERARLCAQWRYMNADAMLAAGKADGRDVGTR